MIRTLSLSTSVEVLSSVLSDEREYGVSGTRVDEVELGVEGGESTWGSVAVSSSWQSSMESLIKERRGEVATLTAAGD